MRTKVLIVMVGAALTLSACFDDDNGNNRLGNGGAPPSALNNAPTISGSPPPTILEGEAYEFIPIASDADSDTLEFTIARKPAWASFDRTTGRLWGTPSTEDVGNFTNIGIEVSDGQASAALVDFDITVNAIALGAATLSWNPPTENTNGTTLNDLAGYRIYYGRNADNLNQMILVNNPGLTRYVVENLTPARWYFSMASVNSQGTEGARSPNVNKTIT